MGDFNEQYPSIHFLLPTCNEMTSNAFLEILKSVVHHTRLQDNFNMSSMIAGMTGETFQVDSEDLRKHWEESTSNARQIRQSKLLGFWTARNYPLFGKKLIGASWQPPNKHNVVVCEPMEINEDELDNIISKKMGLRIVEVTVSEGTSKKLNHFVRVPMCVERVNVEVVSSKMRVFDIPSEYLVSCWEALQVGRFSSNFEQQLDLTSAFRESMPPTETPHLSIDPNQIIRISDDQSNVEKRNSESVRISEAVSPLCQDSVMSSCSVLLTEINANTVQKVKIASESNAIPPAKRKRFVIPNTTAVMHEETQIDVRAAVFEMRKDIDNLTKFVGYNAQDFEPTDKPERFHLAVFKQKDCEISQLKASMKRLENENEVLREDKKKLNGDTEAKSNLISYLEKLLNANSKLHEKVEEGSNAMAEKLADAVKKNEQLQAELTTARGQSDSELKNNQDLLQKLSDAEKLNCELSVMNNQLQDALKAAKNVSSNMDTNMQNLIQKLSAADEANINLNKTNGHLQEDLNASKKNCFEVESNLRRHIQELSEKVSAADQVNQANKEITNTNAKIQQELNSMRDHMNSTELNFHCQTQELSNKLAAADQLNIQLTQATGILQQELADKFQQELNAISEAANTKADLQYQIQELSGKLSASDELISRLTQNNARLEQGLNAAKVELHNSQKLGEKFLDLKARSNNLIEEFRARVEVIEKENALLANNNEKLQEELNVLKQDAGEDNEPLLLSETHIQTDPEEEPVKYQAGLERANVECIGVIGDNHEEINRPSTESFGEMQTITNINKLPPEPVKTDAFLTVERKNDAQNGKKILWEEEFATEDVIVRECRPVLQRQNFGWMKFQQFKCSKFNPAFVYPADEDGIQRAQKIKADGYITDTKMPFWEFHSAWELPDDKKQSQVSSLKKFNKRFGANFD